MKKAMIELSKIGNRLQRGWGAVNHLPEIGGLPS
jgi:hypothetical protein